MKRDKSKRSTLATTLLGVHRSLWSLRVLLPDLLIGSYAFPISVSMVRQITRGRGRIGNRKTTNYKPAVIHATLDQPGCTSICFQSVGFEQDPNTSLPTQCQHQTNWCIPKSIQQVGLFLIYLVVGGAIIRTLSYQYQINKLSAKMLDATSLREQNLERLDTVRKEMAGLSDEFNVLKERNSGLRKERDRDRESILHAKGGGKYDNNDINNHFAQSANRGNLVVGAKEMGNI